MTETSEAEILISAPPLNINEIKETPPLMEVITLTPNTKILRLPDLNGKPIYFPSFRIARAEGFGADNGKSYGIHGGRHEVLEDIASPEMYINSSLEKEQKERLIYALEELKLPAVLAVHAALNTDMDLQSFPKPDKDAPTPVGFAMLGRPAVGKSLITAMLAARENYPIINLDSVSETTGRVYLELFKMEVSQGRLSNADLKNLSVAEARTMVDKVKIQLGSNKNKEPKTLQTMLDQALNQVLASKERSEIYIFDMPGWPGIYNFGTGKDHGRERKHHVIDLVGWEACENGVINTHQLTDETYERKLKWIINDVIQPDLQKWQSMRNEFFHGVIKS